MAATARYFIVVSGERLAFTKDQLESEPESYFFSYFFGGFSESSNETHELIVEKDIQLFKLIQAHLRGYDIFPIPDIALPSYMSREGALASLRQEAQYYGLSRLEERLNQAMKPSIRLPYKVAFHAGTRWVTSEITEDGYQAYLSRFRENTTGITAAAGDAALSNSPGYKVVVSWFEKLGPKDKPWIYALMAPDAL